MLLFRRKPKLDLRVSYLKMIENSVGANVFRNLYFHIDGKSTDVLEDGDLSCGMYVSSILKIFDLIKELHTTVNATVADLEKSNWYKIKEPKIGAVILWGFKKRDDGTQGSHRHVGFYMGKDEAISNDSPTRVVVRHHLTYGTFESGEARRDIQAYYWNDKLNTEKR